MKTRQDLKLLAARVVRLLEKSEKFKAIKLVREKTDYGVKESKDFVDHVERYRERARNGQSMPQPIGATLARLMLMNARAV